MVELVTDKPNGTTPRLRGLDSIRFFMALFVVLVHNNLVFPLFYGVGDNDKIGSFLNSVYLIFFNAPAAVIVFFLISGICIHYQYRNGKELHLLSYYPRRYIRILVPLFFSALLFYAVGLPIEFSTDAVFWSIVCEEIYYLIYPFVLSFSRKFGWVPILVLSYMFSYFVAFSNLDAKAYPSFGPSLNWILGYPCWILGVIAAEKVDTDRFSLSSLQIWCWRFILLILFGLLQGLRFHSFLGYPLTLNVFAIFVFYWLRREICYFKTNNPWFFFEWCGKWSYSIYLTHIPANCVFMSFSLFNFGVFVNWFLRLIWSFLFSYLFYIIIEFPSIVLSKRRFFSR